MLEAPLCAIDLPLKALAWEDSGGQVWLPGRERKPTQAQIESEGADFMALMAMQVPGKVG